jgi:preprotein translocase subunit SecE
MADKKTPESNKKPRVSKKNETVRQRAEKAQTDKPRRLRKTASKVKGPIGRVRKHGKREIHLPLPDNKFGRFLNKRVRILPKFIREAWAEVKLVTWPDRKQTIRLTLAVFVFALVFAIIVGVLDYFLNKLFRDILLDIK